MKRLIVFGAFFVLASGVFSYLMPTPSTAVPPLQTANVLPLALADATTSVAASTSSVTASPDTITLELLTRLTAIVAKLAARDGVMLSSATHRVGTSDSGVSYDLFADQIDSMMDDYSDDLSDLSDEILQGGSLTGTLLTAATFSGTTTMAGFLDVGEFDTEVPNGPTHLGIRSMTDIGTSSGSYQYPFELMANAANRTRLQFTHYRRQEGAQWMGTAFRLQYGVDFSFTQGQKAYLEIGGSDPLTSGGGFVSFGTAGIDRLSINNLGNIGIGTTTPAARLTVMGADGLNQTGLLVHADGEAGDIPFAVRAGANPAILSAADTKFIVDYNGRVGIGTSTPQGTLTVVSLNDVAQTGLLIHGDGESDDIPFAVRAGANPAILSAADTKFIVDYSGRVGIGTTSPSNHLEVVGNGYFSGSLSSINPAATSTISGALNIGSVNYLNTSTAPILSVTGAKGITVAGLFTNQFSVLDRTSGGIAGVGGAISFDGESGGGVRTTYGAISGYKENSVSTDYAGALVFYSRLGGGSLTERMRVSSHGNVGIGTTTPSAQLTTTGSIRFATFGAGTLQTDANGNLSVSSDERLKDITGEFIAGIDAINGLEPILYRWNSGSGLETSNIYAGFSAQNVQNFLPEAVGEDSRGFLTLSDRSILAAVVNAIKEIWQALETNIARDDKQERELQALRARIEQLEAERGVVVGESSVDDDASRSVNDEGGDSEQNDNQPEILPFVPNEPALVEGDVLEEDESVTVEDEGGGMY